MGVSFFYREISSFDRYNLSLYDQVDTKFTFYNPNRSYSDVTRTWSMFVGNTTLIRTVNDTLSSSSSTSQHASKRAFTFHPRNSEEYLNFTPKTDESNHYDEIDLEENNEQVQKEEVIRINLLPLNHHFCLDYGECTCS